MTKLYFTESQSSPDTDLNTLKCSICRIKLETKMISLHKLEVEKISSFLLNNYAVHDFRLLPVMLQVQSV